MPRYILKDGAYNIPEDAMEDFERENPDAMVEYEEEGVLYNVPINDREAFLAEAPNATYTKKGKETVWDGKIDVPSTPKLTYGEVDNKEYLTPAESMRKMMAQGVKQRQQVADMTANIQQSLDKRGAELDEQAKQSAQNFVPRGTAGAVAGFDAGRMADSEYRDYAAAKEALDNAQKLMDEAVASGKNENNKGLFKGFFKSAGRGFNDLDSNDFTFGLKDASENLALLQALDAADEGNATPSQQVLLDAAALQMATQADYGSMVGRGYKAGQVTGQAIPFMVEMAINPLSKAGKSVANRVARHYIKKYLGNEVLEQAAKKGTKYALTRIAPRAAQVVGDIAGAAGMAATTGAANVTADAFKRMQGDVKYGYSKDGSIEYDGHTEGDDMATAFAKAYANSTIENYSEMLGNYFAPISNAAGKGITKGLSKIGLDKVNSFIKEVSANDLALLVSDFENHANWNGTMGEFAEEIAGGVLNSIIVGDQTLGEVFDKDNLIDTALGVSLLGGIMSSAKTMHYPVYKYQAQSNIKKAKIPFDNVFGAEDKAAMEIAFNDSDPRVAGNKLREIVDSEDYNEEQKKAAANYAKTIQMYKGAKLMDDKRFNAPDVPQEEKDVEVAYDKGRTLETPAEMTDANNMYEIKAAEIRDRFGLGEDADEEAINTLFNGDAFQAAMKLREQDEELSDLILDYTYAKAIRDGIIDAARDRISEEQAQSDAIIDYRKNKTDGMIHPATLKTKDANGNDRQVYVVSGNIVTFEDGTINTQESDNDIIIQDAVTGKPEFATAKDLLRAEQALDPEVEKQNVRNTIADTIATEVENKMNNVLSFNVGDAYNVIGADGAEHSVQVMADNGDGSVMASIDNAEAVAMPKSEIQQLSNEYNMNRARLANEAQKEAKQSEKMMQESQNVEPTNMVEQTTEAPAEVVPERIVPTLKDGNPDFNAMDAEMFVDEYVSRYGEDSAVKIARKNISNARENIAKIDKKIDDITDPNQMEGLYVQRKSAEVQIARYSEILERLGASEDANESEADQRNRLRNDAGNRITALFPDGMPNVESFILADIATGNRIRWSDKVTNGVVTSRGLGAELGLSDSKQERTRRLPLIGKDAMTPEEYAESLRERLDAVGIRYDESSLRDAVLGVYQSVDSRKGAWDALENMSKKMQEPQTDMDWEDMQQQMAYNKAQNDNAPALPDMPDLETIEEEVPISGEEAAEIEAQEQTEDYKLSDEVDENGRQFVLASNGNIVFGNIDEESGLTPAPILLSEGIITNPATNDGYGLVHIEARHGDQIRNAGYPSVVSFIEEVAKNYQIIKEGKNRNGNNTYMLQLTDKHNNTLMVELSGDDTYWNINTAGIFKTSYGKNRKEVYNRQTTAKQPAEVVETSQSVESNGTQTPSSLIDVSTPKSSESKDTTSEPQKQEIDEKISQEEQKVNVNPTDGQKEAGNYKKGHVVVDGFNITIEQPKGSVRSGVDADGKEWSITMNNTYGYIRGTEGVDGDHIDVFLSDNLDNWEGEVFVVDQINTDGSFDEHKVMYGFNSIEEAQQAYLSNYSEGWQGLGAITGVSKDEFKKWIESSHRKTKPFAEYKSVKATEGQSAESVEAADDEQILFRGGEKSVQEEVTETIFATAKEKFGTTYDMREAGYILPDGSMLDFSGKHEIRGADTSFLNGQRSVDHRAIQEIAYDFDENKTGVETDMGDFLDRGAIRIDYNTGAINLNVAPTKAQKDRLKRLIERNDGDVYIDFGKGWDTEHYVEYESARASRVLADIDRYFNEGIKPSDNIRFRSAEPAPVFYSNAEYAVKAVKQDKATPEQWLKMIEKNGGLKAGEDKWLGLSDWLKSSDKKTLTKQEVLDFIKENQIQIEEVEYAENPQGFEELKKEYDGWLRDGGYDYAWDKLIERYGYDSTVAFDDVGGELVVQYGNTASKLLGGEVSTIKSTRLDYTTNGLDNKREIALTVPTIESWNESDEIHFGDAGNGRAIAWVRFGETTDADGNRALVIDEVQSKRHQEGREKGYRPSNIEQYLKENGVEVIETGEFYEFHKNGELDKRFSKGLLHNDINRAKELYVGGYVKSDIPSAPFEKNWAELAMKRMLRYAAENGFDKIAWTTGEQQAVRYDISKSVDNIKSEDNNVEETSDGTLIVKNITIYAGGSVHNLFVDANGVVRGREYDGKKLSDIVGKPLAEKLMEQGDFELEGDGLRIGGEGMKAFYDQMIPSFMNKYGKKWGVKVGEVTMPSLEENNTMHSIDVTDAMRESVMQGQPMFRLSDKEQTKLAGWYDNIAERYNVSGNIQVAPSREVFEQTLRDNGVAEDKLAEYDKAAYIPEKDMYLINGDSIKDNIEAERAIFHEVWHKLRKDIITLSELEWLAKSIGSNRLQALNDAFWNGKYETDEAIVDELISVSIEPYIEATVDVDGKPVSAFEAYLDNHITLNEATDAAKANMTEAANEFSDVFDKIFFETKRTLIAYKNQYYGKAQNRVPKRGEQKRTQPSTKQVLEDRPVQTAGVRGDADVKATRAARAEQRQKAIISTATDLASSLGVKMTIIEDLNEINDSNPKMRKSKRGSKAWYDVNTDQVYFVLPNATSVADAQESVLHEVVAHKGLRTLFGEQFDQFLDKIYQNADKSIRAKITNLATQKGWDFRVATEEYLASLAEDTNFEDTNPSWWAKIKELFLEMFDKIGIEVFDKVTLTDNELRYILWRSYQMQKSQGAMAFAEDVLMQQKLGVGNFRTRPAGTRQMTEEEQIIADAKANGTYLKAPNGKKSNLTPKQWVQVRTKAFKEWFGDWEKAARIEKLRKSKDVEITGNEIEASEDLKQYRKNALEYGKTLRGEYVNKDTGEAIVINKDSLTEVLHHDGSNIAHIQSVAAIPQMVESGIYITSEPISETASKKMRNAKMAHYYVCGLKISDIPYTVKFVVAEFESGEKYYDHSLTEIEKGELLNRAELSSTVADSKSPISDIKDKRLVSILQTNSSKIVDANGEPKVVYHRTPNKFTAFDVAKIGSSSDFGAFGNGFYFSPFVEQYRLYGKYKIAAFLNARNPFNLNEENVYDTKMAFGMSPEGQRGWTRTVSKEFTQWLKDNGYDAVVYKTDYNEEEDVVFNPNQIKSATDNVGTFDANNDDIRFRTAPNPADIEDGEVKQIRKKYDKKVNTGRKGTLRMTKYNFIEANQDEMRSLKEYQKLVKEAYGIDKLPSHLDVYALENRIGSAGFEKFNRFVDSEYEVMQQFIDDYIAMGGETLESVIDYARAKSGLERNREFTVRDYIDKEAKAKLITKKEAEKMLEQVNTELQNDIITPTQADARRQQINNMLNTNKNTEEQITAMREQYKAQRDAYRKTLEDDLISYADFNRMSDEYVKKFTGLDVADYSGLSATAERMGKKANEWKKVAADIVEAFENKHDNTKEFWSSVKACNDAVIKEVYDSGMISKQLYDHLKEQLLWYIPMSGFTEDTAEDVYSYIGGETGAFTPPVKKAVGRLSESDDPFAIIANKMQGAILQGNRNRIKLAFLNLVQIYPTDLVTEGKVWLTKQADGTWEMDMLEIPADTSSDDAAQLIEEYNQKMRSLKKQGLAREYKNKLNVPYVIQTRSHQNDHEIIAYRNGQQYVMYVNGNPQLAKAINGKLKDKGINFFYKLLDKWNRIESANKTSWNPDFIAPNVKRDFEDAILSTFIDAGVKDAAKLAKTFVAVFPEVVRSISGSENKSGKYAKYFEEFMQNGGETGYSHLHDVEKWKDINQRRWKRLGLGGKALNTPVQAFNGIGSMFSYLNRIAEDSTRFAAYVHSRQKGKTIGESIKAAKDITTNFNKKGSGATEGIWGFLANFMRRWFLFYNPMVQGIYKHWERMTQSKKRYALVFAAMAGAGYLAAVLNKAATDDDDEEKKYFNQSDHTRRTNIMIYTGDGYIKIPLPPVFREMYALGDIMYSIQCGVITPWEGTKEVVNLVRGLFNLEGQSSLKDKEFSWFRFVIPQSTEFMADIEDNVTFIGTPLYKDTPWNKFDPEYQKVYNGTWTPLIRLSKAINDILPHEDYLHEVDDQMAGKGSSKWINPAVWQHIIEDVTGGVGKTIGDAITIVDNIKNDTETDLYNIPIAKRFYAKPDERTRGRILKNQYYDAIEELDRMNNKYKKYTDYLKANLDPIEIAAKTLEYWDSDEGKLHKLIKDSKSKIDKLNRQLKEAKDDASAEEITLQQEQEMNNLIESLKAMESSNK